MLPDVKDANVLVIPDLHIPFQHPDALKFVRFVDQMWFPSKNRIVVNLGDEIDSHSISRHMPDPNGRSPSDELDDAIIVLQDWYHAYSNMFICSSNHTLRPWKRAFEAGLPKQFMRDIRDVLKAPEGWHWADRWEHFGIVFEHGENVSGPLGALTAAQQNRKSTCVGHLHTFGGVVHSGAHDSQIWGMNAGCLINLSAYAFHYAKNLRKKPTLGCGIVRHGSPFFIPMIVDQAGRWIGAI